MVLDTLKLLAVSTLPKRITDLNKIDHIAILHLAGHIKAEIPEPCIASGRLVQLPATVTAITALGRLILKHTMY